MERECLSLEAVKNLDSWSRESGEQNVCEYDVGDKLRKSNRFVFCVCVGNEYLGVLRDTKFS